MLCTQCEQRWCCVHIGLIGGKGENGYHVAKVLTELIVFFLPNYVNFQLKLTTIFFFFQILSTKIQPSFRPAHFGLAQDSSSAFSLARAQLWSLLFLLLFSV